MKFKIGDKVKISKKKAILWPGTDKEYIPNWHSEEIYTIKEFDKDYKVATLDRKLHNHTGNMINICYLTSLKKERKKKLLRLNALSIMG